MEPFIVENPGNRCPKPQFVDLKISVPRAAGSQGTSQGTAGFVSVAQGLCS